MTPEELAAHKHATRVAHAAAMRARYDDAQHSSDGIEDLLPVEEERPDGA